MRVSLYHNTKVVNALTTATIDSDTATNGATVDLAVAPGSDWRSALFSVKAGTVTDGVFALSVQESDNSSDWTAITAAQSVQGPSATITATGGLAEIAYTGNKRYCRVVITSTETDSGGSLSAVAVLHGTAAFRR